MITAFAHSQGRVGKFLLFTVLGIVALYLRHSESPVLTSEPLLILTSSADSSYYLRLFDLIVAGFPKMPPGVDYYANYPAGLEHFLPPVWPYILAAASIPLSMISGLENAQIAGALMLVLGTATAFPIYFLAKELFGKRAGLLAACIALFNPYFIRLHATGIDHHVADIFIVALVFALFLASIRHLRDGRVKRAIFLAGAGGLLVAFSMLVSLSLTLILGLSLLPVLVATFIMSREELTPVFGVLGLMFGFATLTLGVLSLTTPWFSSSFEFSRLSTLHIAVFGVMGISGLAGYVILSYKLSIRILRIITLTAIMAVFGLVYLSPEIYEILIRGYLRSIGSYPLGVNTIELLPLFLNGTNWPIMYFTYLVFAVPVIITVLITKNWRDRMLPFEHIFFYVILLVLGFYALQAMYYSIYLAIIIVAIYGFGAEWVAGLLSKRMRALEFKGFNDKVIVATVLFLIIAFMTADTMREQPSKIDANLSGLAHFIKAYTLEGGDFYTTNEKPSYAIMSNWSHAYQLQYLSNRATVASGNHDTGMEGIIASEKFYQATSEEEALGLLSAVSAKYVVASRLFCIWEGDIMKIGEATSSPESVARASNLAVNNVLDRFGHHMGVRLFSEPFLAVSNNPPLHNIRLLYISDIDKGNSPFLFYEVVPGARLVLSDLPNTPVRIGTDIHLNNGSSTTWQLEGRTDGQGHFATVIPYSTRGGNSATYADPYRVQVGDEDIKSFDIEESAVVNGTKIILNAVSKE